ncbi:MAG: IS110 family transposase, partial [Bacteroidota bacterium]
DAALLARFCQRERPPRWQPPSPAQRQLRELTRAMEALGRERDRTQNRRNRARQPAVSAALERVLETLSAQIQALGQEIEQHLAAHPELAHQRDLLVSIPGVGSLTAALVLAELGDVSRFESAREAAAYAGLVPRHHESGTSVKRRSQLSKLGNSRLRRALYFPALSAMRHNEAIHVFAERLRARGKAKMAVVGASMRKLLHICFGVLKSGQVFDASLHPSA